jgi:hypothetical protein
MGLAVPLALLLIVGAVTVVVVGRRTPGAPGTMGDPGPEEAADLEEVPAPGEPAAAAEAPAPVDAAGITTRADAERWVERLGAGLASLESTRKSISDTPFVLALASADGRYRQARERLAAAATTADCASAARTAVEGLHYVRGARTVLALDPGPDLPDLGTARVTARDGRVTVEGRTYAVSNRPGGGTPYYYAGGEVAGRGVPAGWYSVPWWMAAVPA